MWKIEVTDTFGGEANYAWVNRYEMPSRYQRNGRPERQVGIMRRAKALAGFTSVRGETISFGDSYEFRPRGACVVMFVTWEDA
jgi:hypothetical protein